MIFLIIFFLLWIISSGIMSIYVFESWEIIYAVLLGLLSSSFLIILSILIVTVIFMLDRKPLKKWKYKLIYHYFSFVLIILRVKYNKRIQTAIPNEPFVVYSNHKSMLDVVLIFQAFRTRLSAVSKSGVYKVPIIKHIMKSCGVISIDRENNREGVKELLKGISLAKEGLSYIIFPEGGIKTREVETIETQRLGAYKLATKSECPIVPVSIIGSSAISKRRFFKKIKIEILIHNPITKEYYQDKNTNEIGNTVGEIINQGIKTGSFNV